MFVKHKVLVVNGGKYADICNIAFNTNWDITTMVIFDLPRTNEGKISYSALEKIKDGFITNTKYETGAIAFNKPHVVVFANFPPDLTSRDGNLTLSADKWITYEIGVDDIIS